MRFNRRNRKPVIVNQRKAAVPVHERIFEARSNSVAPFPPGAPAAAAVETFGAILPDSAGALASSAPAGPRA